MVNAAAACAVAVEIARCSIGRSDLLHLVQKVRLPRLSRAIVSQFGYNRIIFSQKKNSVAIGAGRHGSNAVAVGASKLVGGGLICVVQPSVWLASPSQL